MASGKKTFARRNALRSCPQSGDRAAAAGCPPQREILQASAQIGGLAEPLVTLAIRCGDMVLYC